MVERGLRRVDDPLLVVRTPFDWEQIESERGPERHRAGEYLEIAAERGRLQRTGVVGERDDPVGGRCGLQRDPEQRQESPPVALGYLVGAVEQALGQEREQLDQRDSRIALVEVRPVRVVDRNPSQGLVNQLLVGPRVEHGRKRQSAHPVSPTVNVMLALTCVATSLYVVVAIAASA